MDGNIQQQIDKETNKYNSLYSNNRIELKSNNQSTPHRSPPNRIMKKIEENSMMDEFESNNIKYGKTKQGRPVSANNIRRDNSPINSNKEIKNNEINKNKNKIIKNENNLNNKNMVDTPEKLNHSYVSNNYTNKDKKNILVAINNKPRKNDTFNKIDTTPEKQKEIKNNENTTKK